MAKRNARHNGVMRVSNTIIRNTLQGLDERTLSKIDTDADTRQELRQKGVAIRGLTPLMQQIVKVIELKASEFYDEHEEELTAILKHLEALDKADFFGNRFTIKIKLIYKEIFDIINPVGKTYGGNDIRLIAEAVDALCSLEHALIFKSKNSVKYTYFTVTQSLINKIGEVTVNTLFGDEILGVEVSISAAFVMNMHKRKEVNFVPKFVLPLASQVGKNEVTRYFFEVLTSNAGQLIQQAKKIRKKGEKTNTAPEVIERQVLAALTYQETIASLINFKITGCYISRPALLERMLEKTAEDLKQIGLITEFSITKASNGEKKTNWIINENFNSELPMCLNT